jgi:hypothetical protein
MSWLELVHRIPQPIHFSAGPRIWEKPAPYLEWTDTFQPKAAPSPAIRLAYFMTATILYNLWQAVNLMFRSEDRSTREEKEKGYGVTIPFMVTIFCAHLIGRT